MPVGRGFFAAIKPWLSPCHEAASFWRVFVGCQLAVAFLLPVVRRSRDACWAWLLCWHETVALSLP